jgi:hypothetical protein
VWQCVTNVRHLTSLIASSCYPGWVNVVSQARTRPSADGLLDSRPVEQLLAYAEDRSLTGTFVFSESGADVAAVTFREGRVCRARTQAPMPLGTVLYELGFLDAAGMNAALATLASRASARGPKVLFGDIVRENDAVGEDLLGMAISEQLTRKLTTLFHLPATTRFGFYEGEDLLEGFGRADVVATVGRAVLRGLREAFSMARARDALERVGDRPVVLAGYEAGASSFGLFEALADLELTDDESRVARMLTDPKPLSVFELQRPGSIDARVVYALLLLRRARVAASTPRSEALRHASLQFRAPSPLRPPSVEVPISGVHRAVVRDPRREGDERQSEPKISAAAKPSPTPSPSRAEVQQDPALARMKARGLVRRSELASALAIVEQLRDLAPRPEAELETLYGYCLGLTRSDLDSREQARTALLRGVALAPRSGDALFRLALFERHEGRLADALRHMKEAVAIDPHHIDAVRELRLFHMRVAGGMNVARAMSPPGGIPAVKDPRKE